YKMFQRSRLPKLILVLLKIVSISLAILYEFEFEDDEVFTKCLDNPDGFKDKHGLFDFTNFSFEMGAEGIVVSGNFTSVWDVEPTDRIELRSRTLYWERGSWQPTILNVYVSDFCKVMYDKNQIWYISLTEHISNKEEIRDKCVTHKGTLFVIEPYLMEIYFGAGMVFPSGRHRIIINMVAIDLNNVTRPNGICYEFVGTFFKV
ncbi:hypothetical protein KR200_003491, partial [Drosophila serrata]